MHRTADCVDSHERSKEIEWASRGATLFCFKKGGFGLPFWGDAAPYCKGYFFFFIILSGFGENLLSHLSSTAVAGFAAASADETKPEKHQR